MPPANGDSTAAPGHGEASLSGRNSTTAGKMESRQGQVLNLERVRELDRWLKATNTKLIQVNGQRKYGGPPEVWEGPIPGVRCEVFISQIPRDTYEDQLIPLFSSVGPLWEFRLMMNFSGQNRGFAYAKYGSSILATTAIRMLHGHMLEPGFHLCVRRSTEKRHLCIGELPATTRQEDLLKVLRLLTEGVERLSLKTGPGINGVSAIVVFSSHHAASMAKKVLNEAFKKQFGLTVSIKWQSLPKPSSDETPSPQLLLKGLFNPPQPFTLPLHLNRSPSTPPGFCRAVGGPAVPQPPICSSATSSALQMHEMSALSSATPMVLLHKMSEAAGLGQPVYEMFCSHGGTDGFIYFTYKVCIPGINSSLEGVVRVLPGPSPAATLEEARRTAAEQILLRIYHNQLAR